MHINANRHDVPHFELPVKLALGIALVLEHTRPPTAHQLQKRVIVRQREDGGLAQHDAAQVVAQVREV